MTGSGHVGAIIVTSSTPLWYATTATGLVALVLLTAGMALGLLSSVRFRRPAWPRFVTLGLDRNLALPSYRPIWVGLGAVAPDLMLAGTAWLRVGPLSSHWSTRSGARSTPAAGAARPDYRANL
jgi:hypothetical protein